jgi:hypothetical protein
MWSNWSGKGTRLSLLGWLFVQRTRSWRSTGGSSLRRLGAIRSRYGDSMQSMLLPSESSARYKLGPFARNADICFIDSPGPIRMPDMTPDSFVENRSVPQHPASNRGMIDAQPTFRHHLFQIAIAEGIPEIPAHTEHELLHPGSVVLGILLGGSFALGLPRPISRGSIWALALCVPRPVPLLTTQKSAATLTRSRAIC